MNNYKPIQDLPIWSRLSELLKALKEEVLVPMEKNCQDLKDKLEKTYKELEKDG